MKTTAFILGILSVCALSSCKCDFDEDEPKNKYKEKEISKKAGNIENDTVSINNFN